MTIAAKNSAVVRSVWAIIGCAIVAGALRLPFVWAGLGVDEGGYAYVAQQWARGAHLYEAAWLDRPQGLLITYRMLLWLNESGGAIRLGAVLIGILLTLLLGLIGWLLVGRKTGIATAAIYAVVGVAPRLDGFTLNGELLASLPATAAIAGVLLWRRFECPWWLLVAGLCAGVAITMKPSGIDGIAVCLAFVALSAGPLRTRALRIAMIVGAIAIPLGMCAIHGWYLGWSHYWTAIAGYQLDAMGSPQSNLQMRWVDFGRTVGTVGKELAVLAIIASIGLWKIRKRTTALLTLTIWLLAAIVGINLGGSYWGHYYIQLLPVLALLAAIAVTSISPLWLRGAVLVGTMLPALLWAAALVPMTSIERQGAIHFYDRALRDQRIANVVQTQTRRTDQIFVLESEANLYFLAQRTTRYPYLWGKPIDKIPNSLDRLRTLLTGPDRPELVLVYTDTDQVDPSGALEKDLEKHYRLERTVEDVTFLRVKSSPNSV